MGELEVLTSYCQLCGDLQPRRTMRRPHGCDWWCTSCLASYEDYRRTRTWFARKIGVRPVNIGVAGLVLTTALCATGVFTAVSALVIFYAAYLSLIPIGVVQARASRRAFMRSAQARLPAARIVSPSPQMP